MPAPDRPETLGTNVEITLTLWFPTDDVDLAHELADHMLRPVMIRMGRGTGGGPRPRESMHEPVRRVVPSSPPPEQPYQMLRGLRTPRPPHGEGHNPTK